MSFIFPHSFTLLLTRTRLLSYFAICNNTHSHTFSFPFTHTHTQTHTQTNTHKPIFHCFVYRFPNLIVYPLCPLSSLFPSSPSPPPSSSPSPPPPSPPLPFSFSLFPSSLSSPTQRLPSFLSYGADVVAVDELIESDALKAIKFWSQEQSVHLNELTAQVHSLTSSVRSYFNQILIEISLLVITDQRSAMLTVPSSVCHRFEKEDSR